MVFGKKELCTAVAVLAAVLIFFVGPGASLVQAQAATTLSITKTDSPDPVFVGEELTYTITVRNTGNADATDVVIRDRLPANVTVVSAAGCTVMGRDVTCNIGTLAAGQMATRQIVVRPTAPGTLTNDATVTSPDADARSARATTTVNLTDLEIRKRDDLDQVDVGEVVSFTIGVINLGPNPSIQNVIVSDALPDGVSPIGDPVASRGDCEFVGDTVVCNLGQLGVGETATVRVDVLATTAGTITNTARVSAIFDPDTSNNTATVTTEVRGDVEDGSDGDVEDGDNTEDVEEEIDETEEETAETEEEIAETEEEDGGVTATADADEQNPVENPQGEVVDEVANDGPLPNTGGISIAAGVVPAMVLFGVALLVLRLAGFWRAKRT